MSAKAVSRSGLGKMAGRLIHSTSFCSRSGAVDAIVYTAQFISEEQKLFIHRILPILHLDLNRRCRN